LDSNTEITLSALAYDNFGRLNEKKLHGAKETIAYTYNIRNWLKTITSTNFSETLYYNESFAENSPVFNGNISATVSPRTFLGAPIQRGYLYTYDGLNRMTKARYMENSTVKNSYNEELAYDKQGNVIEFTRNSPVSSSSSTYNSEHLYLRYTGNQLNSTNTSAGLSTLLLKNIYNKNGALTADPNRKISDIRYNVLNLPDTIKFSAGHSAQYSYDAAGVKRSMKHITVENTTVVTLPPSAGTGAFIEGSTLPKIVSTPISNYVTTSTSSTTSTASTASIIATPTRIVDQTVTDYCGPVIYENGNLKYILTPEGYVSKNGSTVVYNYYLKDHLGNNRVVTVVNGSNYMAIQKTDYYPFGKPYADSEFQERQPYKFGGKEYDEMFGMNQYDFEARQLDAMIPRFTTMDPLAEKYYSISPYAYCGNNPIKYVDPTGMEIEDTPESWHAFYSALFSTYFTMLILEQNNKNGKHDERIANLRSTLSTMNTVANSDQVYSFNQLKDKGTPGGIVYDPKTGKIIINYFSIANTIHEITHAGQFETGDIAFDSRTGNTLAQDVFDEVAAYQAQFAYSPSSVSDLTSTSVANSFGTITPAWVQGLAGGTLYVPGGTANTGIAPLNINSTRTDFINAYPNNPTIRALPTNFILRTSYTNIYYKR
jgi:RHS repeat-associated protein